MTLRSDPARQGRQCSKGVCPSVPMLNDDTAQVSNARVRFTSSTSFRFALFFNGLSKPNNIATLGTTKTAVSIKSVNCGNPYNSRSNNTYCSEYVNNDLRTIAVPLDGFTKPLTARGIPQLGRNVLTIAITDVGDRKFDSAVFLQANSFSCKSSSTETPSSAPSKHPTTHKPTVVPTKTTKQPTSHRNPHRTRRPTARSTRAPITVPAKPPVDPVARCLQVVQIRCDCGPLCSPAGTAADWSCPRHVVQSECPQLGGSNAGLRRRELQKSKGGPGRRPAKLLYRQFRSSCHCPAVVVPVASSKSKKGSGHSHKMKKGRRV